MPKPPAAEVYAAFRPMLLSFVRATARRFRDPDLEELESHADYLFCVLYSRFDPTRSPGEKAAQKFLGFTLSRGLRNFARRRAVMARRTGALSVTLPARSFDVDRLCRDLSADADRLVREVLDDPPAGNRYEARRAAADRAGITEVACRSAAIREVREALSCRS